MIDLSNNNGNVSFQTLHAHRQFRVYLKRSEGHSFVDPTFDARHLEALRAGIKIGAYHFARPSESTPREEADFFLRLLPELKPGRHLRPCLDFEDPNAPADPKIGKWAVEWLTLVRAHIRYHPIIYGGAYYLEPCRFRPAPAWLWLAAYGRNDGKEHPYVIPHPWRRSQVLAHQYASVARIPGVEGEADISHVLRPRLIDIPHRWSLVRR